MRSVLLVVIFWRLEKHEQIDFYTVADFELYLAVLLKTLLFVCLFVLARKGLTCSSKVNKWTLRNLAKTACKSSNCVDKPFYSFGSVCQKLFWHLTSTKINVIQITKHLNFNYSFWNTNYSWTTDIEVFEGTIFHLHCVYCNRWSYLSVSKSKRYSQDLQEIHGLPLFLGDQVDPTWKEIR